MKDTNEKHQLGEFQSMSNGEVHKAQHKEPLLDRLTTFTDPSNSSSKDPSKDASPDDSSERKAESIKTDGKSTIGPKEGNNNDLEAKVATTQRVALSDLCNPVDTASQASDSAKTKALSCFLPAKETIDYRSALTSSEAPTKQSMPSMNPASKPTAPFSSKASALLHRDFLGKLDYEEIRKKEEFKVHAEKYAEVQIKSTALSRLYDLYNCINSQESGISYIKRDSDQRNNCILGFQQLEVKQPQFNLFIRKMVQENKLWHGLGGARSLKKPTWVIYELLRQIGVRPQKHCRGPKEHDPDPKDFMYATRYIFCRDTLVKNRHRLEVDGIAKGRPRDMNKVSSDNQISITQHGANQGRAEGAGKMSNTLSTVSIMSENPVNGPMDAAKSSIGASKGTVPGTNFNNVGALKEERQQPHLSSKMLHVPFQPPSILTASSSLVGLKGSDPKGLDLGQISRGQESFSSLLKRDLTNPNKGEQALSARAQYVAGKSKESLSKKAQGGSAEDSDDPNLQAACTALLSLASEGVVKKERGTNKRSRSEKGATSPAKRSLTVDNASAPAPTSAKLDAVSVSPPKEQPSPKEFYNTPTVVRSDDSLIHIFAQSRAIVYGSDFVDDELRSRLDDAVRIGEINPNSAKRLLCLHELLVEAQHEKIATFIKSEDPAKNCILGWSKLEVHDPYELNLKVKKMVDEDKGGIWKKANGKYNQPLKNPTWGVYELFRKIGSKPCLRGPADKDPGKTDMFYYREWEFRNDESFQIAKKRLSKGFSQCQKRNDKEAQAPPRLEP